MVHATSLAAPLALVLTQFASAQSLFAPPPTPSGNPTTAAKAMLGKVLFWDEQLSSSRTVACGTCHMFAGGGSDLRSPQATHPGADGQFGTDDDIHGSLGIVRQDAVGNYVGDALFLAHAQSSTRRAPSVVNAAYENLLFRDGRANGRLIDPMTGSVLALDAPLENQALQSPVDDAQMAHVGRTWDDITDDIACLTPLALADQLPCDVAQFVRCETYSSLFRRVFGSRGVTPARVAKALAAYERTLIADQTRYDRYLANQGPLTAPELAGLAVFNQHCSSCHTDLQSHTRPVANDFRATGVRPSSEDPGRFAVTGNAADLGRFKVPGLRNVALRAPYMHNGGLPTLDAVISFYNRGGDFGPGIDPAVTAIAGRISTADRANLLAFLQTLTDPRVEHEVAPFDRPRLWSEGTRVPAVFGHGTAGPGTAEPQMVALPPAWLGTTKFTLGLDGVAAGVPHSFVLDFDLSPAPIMVFGHETHMAQSMIRYYGMGTTRGAGPNGGFSSIRFEIPDDGFLLGLPLVGQWFVADAASPFGMASSKTFQTEVFR